MNYNSKVEMKLGAEIMIKLPSNEHLVCVWCHDKCFKHFIYSSGQYSDRIITSTLQWRTKVLEWLGELPKLALLS